MKLYFASGNEHKKIEMSRILGGFELLLPKDCGIEFDVEETGNTFIENSIIKAQALYNIVKEPVIADDSGLIVPALNGEPGIYTARYGEKEAGRKLSSEEKYMYLLDRMKTLRTTEERKAQFTAAICLMLSPTRVYIVQESVDGYITFAPSGSGGFGYDPVFFINEAGKTASELKGEDKDRYSHRGKAARAILPILLKEAGNDR